MPSTGSKRVAPSSSAQGRKSTAKKQKRCHKEDEGRKRGQIAWAESGGACLAFREYYRVSVPPVCELCASWGLTCLCLRDLPLCLGFGSHPNPRECHVCLPLPCHARGWHHQPDTLTTLSFPSRRWQPGDHTTRSPNGLATAATTAEAATLRHRPPPRSPWRGWTSS